jgi:hypothetical protein
MTFQSKWLDWQPGQKTGIVSNVSESPIRVQKPVFSPKHLISQKYRKKESFFRYAAGGSKKSSDIYDRGTDITDNNPAGSRSLNGHKVHRVVWSTEAAVIFQDERGRFWRHLYAYGKTWPVIVMGGGGSKR